MPPFLRRPLRRTRRRRRAAAAAAPLFALWAGQGRLAILLQGVLSWWRRAQRI